MSKLLLTCFCLFSIVVFSGCGPSAPATVPASGTVLLDGKPLDGATITFISPKGVVAHGISDSNGKFSVTTSGAKSAPGALPGLHKVGVSKSVNEGAGAKAANFSDPKEMAVAMGGAMVGNVKTTFIVASRYNSPETSGLTIDIPADGNQTIELKVSAK
jgi:hypothetical protein